MFATRFFCFFFLLSNNKNISGVKKVQVKIRNTGKTSDLWQDPNKVIFNFSSYNLDNHEKSVFCKGLNFAIPSKE